MKNFKIFMNLKKKLGKVLMPQFINVFKKLQKNNLL
jgi:hypothetical protein